MKALYRVCLFATLVSLAAPLAIAQQRVHALSGMVTAIHPKIAMISVEADDGSSLHFRWLKQSDGPIEFDKNVSADATAADKFATSDTNVIVYYFGEGDVRTVVALHDLGSAPVEKKSGAVVKFNRHDHLLVIKSSDGAEESFRIDPKTVADTETGVTTNFKFDYNKGDRVRVTASTANGSATALLIAPLM